MKRSVVWMIVMITAVLLALFLGSKDVPAEELAQPSSDITVVRAYYNDKAMVSEVAVWTEPWEVNRDEGYIVLEATSAEIKQLEAMGFRVEVDQKLTTQYNTPRTMSPDQISGIPGYACYRTVEETFASAETIAADYPNLATWTDVGDSWEKVTPGGNDGYDMMVLKLTNSAIVGPKPKLFIMTSVHAREYTTAELNTRFAEYLVANYGVNADVTWMLDYNEIHLMLQANPDGRKQAEAGSLWRKNTNQNYCGATSTSRGADLNRNYPFHWGGSGSSGVECNATYRGSSAESEPETQAVTNYVRANYDDLRPDDINIAAPITTTGVFLDVHSYSELVLWSWGDTASLPPNHTGLQTLGRKFAYFNDYHPEQAIGLYPTDGTTDDFAYGELGLPAYTFELGTDFFQDCGTFESTIFPDNLEALIYAAKVTRRPYMTPAGPDALSLGLSGYGVEEGTAVTLTVTLNDTHYSANNGTEPTQNISAGQYSIDVPIWEDGVTAYAMMAVDGNFNSSVENAYGVIDTTGLSDGRHILYTRGQDAAGNWGAVSAEFFYILDPVTSPIISGTVIAADTGLPLTATIQTNSVFQATADGSGVYQMQVISGTYELTAVSNNPDYGAATATVSAYDNQTVIQNFQLYPSCEIFSDDVEGGINGWTVDSPWAITTASSHSPTHSWRDSTGDYGNNQDISLTSPVFDLIGYSDININYWQMCNTESGYDYCILETSTDNGASWNEIARWDGLGNSWEEIAYAVPALNGQAQAQVRFHLSTDVSVTEDGWYVDDISIIGSGAGCVQTTVPTAVFTSSSPDALGTTTTFTNSSTGGELNHAWNFGDGNAATMANPTHSYAATGTYTVTLQVTNTLGVDVYTETVDIMVGATAVFSTTAPVIVGDSITFTNQSQGDALTYIWDFGDGNGSTDVHPMHTYAATGTYTVMLTASNPAGTDVVTSTLEVMSIPTALFSVDNVIAANSPITFTNGSSGGSLSYLWDFGDGNNSTAVNPTHTYDMTGTYTVMLTASNLVGTDVVTQMMDVLLIPTAVFSTTAPVIAGDSITFTNQSQGDALTYIWDFGDGITSTMTSPSHLYDAAGTYTVTLTAVNAVGTDVSAQQVTIYPRYFYIYLPMITRP